MVRGGGRELDVANLEHVAGGNLLHRTDDRREWRPDVARAVEGNSDVVREARRNAIRVDTLVAKQPLDEWLSPRRSDDRQGVRERLPSGRSKLRRFPAAEHKVSEIGDVIPMVMSEHDRLNRADVDAHSLQTVGDAGTAIEEQRSVRRPHENAGPGTAGPQRREG